MHCHRPPRDLHHLTTREEKAYQRTRSKSSTRHSPRFIVGITIGSAGSLFGLVRGLLGSACCRFADRVDTIIQTLAQALDFGNAVQILDRKSVV